MDVSFPADLSRCNTSYSQPSQLRYNTSRPLNRDSLMISTKTSSTSRNATSCDLPAQLVGSPFDDGTLCESQTWKDTRRSKSDRPIGQVLRDQALASSVVCPFGRNWWMGSKLWTSEPAGNR
eukprot:CAMPEP_0206527884 /NCGR_PEP_ID=MMETSP0325_2-20121206/1621_1 /ASSEMBLY_ACC=CAM_ASM_000347 /TAXON_ID=2866 /ORGANISM="Crypthecodinium cohnii, Strain Seligo" /LENGTH=121 /DNA_ID=CAMNT_0054023393 /DNA_START=472 /DNA_END=834 /DNA_ORIENTATION=-